MIEPLGPPCRHGEERTRCAVCTSPDDPAMWYAEPQTDLPDGMPDDPRFDWVDAQTIADQGSVWIKGRCNHLTPAPVDLRTGELVAWWCPDCGEQFDRNRWPVPDGMWLPLPDIVRPPGFKESITDSFTDLRITGTAGSGVPWRAFWDGLKFSVAVLWPVWLVVFACIGQRIGG